MQNTVFRFIAALAVVCLISSCYTYQYDVGRGAQTGVTVTEKNQYLIYGLAPLNTSDPIDMAGGATDYTVKVEHTFVDGLLAAITFGIYTPTTTTVTR